MTRCKNCGRIVEIPEPYRGKDWLHTKNDEDIGMEKVSNDPVLIHLVNSNLRENVWLCGECFKEWCRFHSKSSGMWSQSWSAWLRSKEMVMFT